jgi:hypothetical protein
MSAINPSAVNIMSTSAAKTTTKKSTKATESVASAPAPVVAATATLAPVTAAPAKASKKAAAAPAPVVAAPVVATPIVAAEPSSPSGAAVAAVEEDVSVSLQKSITELQEQLSGLKSSITAAFTTLKSIEKQASRVIKKAERRRNKSKAAPVEGAEPKACIFTKPVHVSDQMCDFLGKAKGTEVSRASVTRAIVAYAKTHNLMKKQQITTDATLRKLLSLNESDSLTILNLQTYLSKHYPKAAAAPAATATA